MGASLLIQVKVIDRRQGEAGLRHRFKTTRPANAPQLLKRERLNHSSKDVYVWVLSPQHGTMCHSFASEAAAGSLGLHSPVLH